MSPAHQEARHPAGRDHELELKYSVTDPDAVRELVAADSIARLTAGPWRTLEMVDRYLDTPTGALERAGYGVRLRRVDHRTLLTVKSVANESGTNGEGIRRALHRRVELEGVAGRGLDPGNWPDSPARALVEATVGSERLRTLFVIDQQREERDLLRTDGSIAATLSLDAAEVRRRGRHLGSFATLEIEAADADGPAGTRELDELAAELEASGLVEPEDRSKEQIGLALVAGDQRREADRPPRTPGVGADDPLAEAGRKVLRMHLLRMLAAEAGVRAGEDIEAVHKMRVATRRMRAAWRVFDGAYRPKLQRRYVKELRSVAAALGSVRDMDVQLERLSGYAASLPSDEAGALAPLVDELRTRRAGAGEQLIELLDSADYEKFVADYRSFVDTPGAGVVDGTGRVRDAAAGRAWRAYEHVRAHETVLPWADVPALHALRIDGKRLRYTLEFFREALPASTDPLIAQVTAMQDHLGLLNDGQVAADLTRGWLMSVGSASVPATRQAAGAYLRASEADVARLTRSFRPLWRRVAGAPFRRRLALALGTI